MTIKWEKDDRANGWRYEVQGKGITAWVTVEHHGNDEWYLAGHAADGKLVHHSGGIRCPPPSEEGVPNKVWDFAVEKTLRQAVAGLTVETMVKRKKRKTIKRTRIKR